jgi:hypothetical protein
VVGRYAELVYPLDSRYGLPVLLREIIDSEREKFGITERTRSGGEKEFSCF